MNVNYLKTLWKSSLMVLFLCLGLSSWGQTYELVTSDTQLEEGAEYLILGKRSNNTILVMTTTQNSNNRAGVVISGTTLPTTLEAETNYAVFELGLSDGHWTFYDAENEGFLYAASSSSNHLRTRPLDSDGNSRWEINIDNDNNIASVVAQGTNSRKVMQLNNANNQDLFACYGSASQAPVYLYKKQPSTPSYTLTYTAGENGTIDGVSPQTVQEEQNGTAVTAVPNEGYHFVNWSDESTDNPRTDTNVTADISVTANFAINTYTVTYDGNGNDGGTAPIDENTHNHGSDVTVLGHGDLTLTDHSFLSWNTQADGLGTAYLTGSIISNITSDITLYAQWLDDSLEPQTITFEPLANVTYGDAAFNLTATSDSGLAVSYASSNENVATIDGNTLTIVGVGTTDITASQLGDEINYQPAVPVVQTLTVNQKNLTISGVTVEDKPYDGTTNATIDASDATLNGVVGTDDVDFATGTGEFVSADAGSDIAVTLTSDFTMSGTAAGNYTLTQPVLTGNILKADQTLSGFENITKHENEEAFALPATTAQGLALTYESSNTAVATISGNTVTIVGIGTTTITATQAGNVNYNEFEDTITLEVTEAPAEPCFEGQAVNQTLFTRSGSTTVGGGSTHIRLGSSSSSGTLTTSALTEVSGNVTLRIEARGWSSTEKTFYVTLGDVQGIGIVQSTFGNDSSTTFEWVELVLENVPLNPELTIMAEGSGGNGRVIFRTIELYCTPSTDPLLTVSATAIDGLETDTTSTYNYIGSFYVNGINLDETEVTVTAPENFEVSTDEVNFYSSVTLTSVDGEINSSITVRLAPDAPIGINTGNITISGGGAAEVMVAVTGEMECTPNNYGTTHDGALAIEVGETFQINYFTDNTSTIVYSSSDSSVVTVDQDGLVTATGAGSTLITIAQVTDGVYCESEFSINTQVTSTEPALVISGDADMGETCLQGDTIQANYTVTNNGGSTANNVVFLNSNPAFQVFPPVSPQNIAPGGFVTFTVTFNPMMGALPNTNNNTLTAMSNGITLASHNITATVNMPTLGTVATEEAFVNGNNVTFIGNVTSLGSCWNATEYGFVYGTTENPTDANFSIIAGTNPSFATPFQFTLDGVLTPGTTYYYRAYIKNFQGIYVYGNEESFTTTLSTPTATAATTVTSNSFTANWNAVEGATGYELNVWTMESGGFATDLFISEYVEAAPGNRKAIEIFNGTAETISLANYTLKLAANGGNWSGTPIQLSGSIPSGEVFVIAHGSDGGFPADQTTTSLNFNGDDAVGLFKDNVLIDIFGIQGQDPGTGWEVNGVENATVDRIITRNSNIDSPNTTWTHSEWTVGISYTNAEGDSAAQTALSSHTFDGGSTQVYILQNQNVGNVTSYEVNGLEIGNTYTYNVKAITADVTTVKSNDVSVITYPEGVIWTSGNAWLNDVQPTTGDDVYVLGNLTVSNSNSFAAKTLTVNGSLTIQAGGVVEVEEGIVNQAAAANFVVENDGILLQNTNASNTGAITVKRNSNPMFRLDYTLWSSPVAMNLVDFSEVSATSPEAGEGTLWNRVYTLGEFQWEQVWATQPDVNNDTTPFVAGQGYLYRSPNLWVTRGNENEDPAQAYPGVFTGVPNNGTVNAATPYEFSAIGNPYPSPIDADILMTENADIDYIYFWTNTHAPLDGSYDDVPNNWAYYNMSGGTATDGGVVPNGTIQPGQGFVAKMINNTNTVNFNNGQRISSNNHFFRQMASERHRFWLNLSNSEEVVFNQILVGYMNNATQGIDTGMDAKMVAYEGNALYSIIENSDDNYVIQGRSLPFTDSDVVALGFRAVNAGSFTISLANLDGLFADNQNIYLKDNFSQAVYNLKDGAYSFVSEEGVFNTRFEVVYQTTMSVENPVANNANWVVYSQEDGYQIQTQGFELKTVQVFDLLGRTIYTANAQGTAHNIPSLGADSVYIVKVTTTDNVVLSKKVK